MKIARRALWQLILDISDFLCFTKKVLVTAAASAKVIGRTVAIWSLSSRRPVSMGGHVQHHLLRIPFHYHPLKGFIHKPKATESQKIDIMK